MTKKLIISILILIIVAIVLFRLLSRNQPQNSINEVQNQTITSDQLNQKAIQAIESKFQISANTIKDVRVKTVDWPDSSLGCPQENQLYAQVITQGYLISLTLKPASKVLFFHSNQDFSQILQCPEPQTL